MIRGLSPEMRAYLQGIADAVYGQLEAAPDEAAKKAVLFDNFRQMTIAVLLGVAEDLKAKARNMDFTRIDYAKMSHDELQRRLATVQSWKDVPSREFAIREIKAAKEEK